MNQTVGSIFISHTHTLSYRTSSKSINFNGSDEKFEKANDPNVKPSERLDAQFEANKAAAKAAEHHIKAEEHKAKHAQS
ncbi:unnamed protein product [Adineta ricciae]|uniref:Uncharacterized protein n=1 Tax=Adineta ricciae TaxID=249248 RepID=A0A815LKC9_ADIRI|nr:unnamed protein product [Adineta ricciae]